MPDLVVEGIHTAYGLSRVLFDVSLEVREGECIALIGRNGVGKTTTMRSIMGLTPPFQGRVTWKGHDIAGFAPHRICRLGIGFVPEDRRIFPELSVWENLDIGRRSGADRGRALPVPRSGVGRPRHAGRSLRAAGVRLALNLTPSGTAGRFRGRRAGRPESR